MLWGTVSTRQKLPLLSLREDGAAGAEGLLAEESAYTHSVTCSALFAHHHIFEEIRSGPVVGLGPPLVSHKPK